MDTLTAIELLREVLLGEKRKPLPDNSVQKTRAAQRRAEKLYLQSQTTDQPQRVDGSITQRVEKAAAQRVEQSPEEEPNYISDDDEPHPPHPPQQQNPITLKTQQGMSLKRKKMCRCTCPEGVQDSTVCYRQNALTQQIIHSTE